MENNKLTLYVVEDTLFYQQLIDRTLKPLYVQAMYFTSGEDAVTQLPIYPPHLVILDYNLEGVMTGLDTLREIRRQYPAVYVILFSTRFEINTEENFRTYGVFDFVEKNGEGFRVLHQKIIQAISFSKPEA